MEVYKKTKSFCPQCQKVLDTDIIEKNGSMWLKKTCPKDGPFEAKIAKRAWFYKGLDSYRNNLFNKSFFEKHNSVKIYSASITSKCNLNCPICFAGGQQSKIKEMPIDFLREQLEKLKNKELSIRFTGGEPTLREDLPELIKMVKKSGNEPSLYTNGVKIADDLGYSRLLKKCGLNTVYLWMDTLKNPEVYKKFRGKNFMDIKLKAIENLKKTNIPLTILTVMGKGINENEMGDFIEFVKKERGVNCLYIQSYNYLGSCGLSPNQEFLIDELAESVASQSQNLFTIEDLYYLQKVFILTSAIRGEAPPCPQVMGVFIPRGKEKPLHHIFKYDKFSAILDEFEKIWQEDQRGAKKYLLLKCLPKILTDPDFYRLYWASKKIGGGTDALGSPPFKNYFLLVMVAANNILNLDIERTQRWCNNHSLNHTVEKNVPRCFKLLEL